VRQKIFVHPGLLHSQAELDFVRGKLKNKTEPWATAWGRLKASSYDSLDWRAKPTAGLVRDLNSRWRGAREIGEDAIAAYTHALDWSLSGEAVHAHKAAEILNAWSKNLKTITGHDAKLLGGIVGYKLCNAAELLKTGRSEWTVADNGRFDGMMTNVFVPLLRDFFPSANGNWDASMIVTLISIGIVCDDPALYARAKDYFLSGPGQGALNNYVFSTGQCQESTRDQQHTQLGLAFLADACETAWKQGDNLWGAQSNRLALGFEYTARYNLGEEVPVEGGKKISAQGRGRFRPIYEKVYHHYHGRAGMEMPYTRQVLQQTRPEGTHWDHAPWGTLMFFDGAP
jgi:hypothetical protein